MTAWYAKGLCTNMNVCCLLVLDGRCVPYSGAVCQHVLGVSSSVYVAAFIADAVAVTDSIINNQLSQLTPQCRNVTIGTLCRYAFPDCTSTAGFAKSQPLCRQVVFYSHVAVITLCDDRDMQSIYQNVQFFIWCTINV